MDAYGKCHICGKLRMVGYCEYCKHWFCGDCREEWFCRWEEAMKQFFFGRQEGCCGPSEV